MFIISEKANVWFARFPDFKVQNCIEFAVNSYCSQFKIARNWTRSLDCASHGKFTAEINFKVGNSRGPNIFFFTDYEKLIIFTSPSIISKNFNNSIYMYDFRHCKFNVIRTIEHVQYIEYLFALQVLMYSTSTVHFLSRVETSVGPGCMGGLSVWPWWHFWLPHNKMAD